MKCETVADSMLGNLCITHGRAHVMCLEVLRLQKGTSLEMLQLVTLGDIADPLEAQDRLPRLVREEVDDAALNVVLQKTLDLSSAHNPSLKNSSNVYSVHQISIQLRSLEWGAIRTLKRVYAGKEHIRWVTLVIQVMDYKPSRLPILHFNLGLISLHGSWGVMPSDAKVVEVPPRKMATPPAFTNLVHPGIFP